MIDGRGLLKIGAFLWALVPVCFAAPARAEEVIVLGGVGEAMAWLEAQDWWGEEKRGEQLLVPRAIITGINPSWREASQALTVRQKKEIFYRLMLPLIVHANEMVLERRALVLRIREQLATGANVADADFEALRQALPLLRVTDAETASGLTASSERLPAMIDEVLYKLDVIPAGLALGQAAYESGYGTSRFAVGANALFGQWTYGGKGLVPEQQRKDLGDHRIAAYDWPFDSVRGYFLNLMSHPAYEEFRRLRAQMRAAGEPLASIALADGLISYSERGQEYVDTLKGMIRTNNLAIADDAAFRDEPMRFLVGAGEPGAVAEMRGEIERMRGTGELEQIVDRMRLE